MLTCDAAVIRRAARESLLFADFVADDATNGSATDRSNRTASGQDSTTYGTHAGADGRVLVLI